MSLGFKKINDLAILPKRSSPLAAGLDLFSIENRTVNPNERVIIKTGLSAAIPPDHYGRIAPRSGLAVKYGLDVLAGVVDSDYRGEILICLINLGSDKVNINIGDKIAQLIIEKCSFLEPTFVENLDNTERGEGKFGSTGLY